MYQNLLETLLNGDMTHTTKALFALLVLAIAACGPVEEVDMNPTTTVGGTTTTLAESSAIDAGVMCEEFINQRVGSPVEHQDYTQAEATEVATNEWKIRSAFTEPSDGSVTQYECHVTYDGIEEWTLVDLTTDR